MINWSVKVETKIPELSDKLEEIHDFLTIEHFDFLMDLLDDYIIYDPIKYTYWNMKFRINHGHNGKYDFLYLFESGFYRSHEDKKWYYDEVVIGNWTMYKIFDSRWDPQTHESISNYLDHLINPPRRIKSARS